MNSKQVSKILEKEISKIQTFQNYHGISKANLNEYFVDPFLVVCDLDDGLSGKSEVWIVLQLSKTAQTDIVIVYNPTEHDWGVAEFNKSSNQWVLTVSASSLTEALEVM